MCDVADLNPIIAHYLPKQTTIHINYNHSKTIDHNYNQRHWRDENDPLELIEFGLTHVKNPSSSWEDMLMLSNANKAEIIQPLRQIHFKYNIQHIT